MPEAKPYHHKNLRESLIEAGIRIMNEQGFDQLSMRKLADACGVSRMAPYRHFADKEALLKEMQAYVESQFAQILQQAIDDGRQATHPMLTFGKAYVTFFVQHPSYYAFFTRQEGIWVNIASGSDITSNYLPFLIFKEQAALHLESMHVPQALHTTAMASMWATVHGLAGMATMPSVHYDGDWGELTERVLIGVQPHA